MASGELVEGSAEFVLVFLLSCYLVGLGLVTVSSGATSLRLKTQKIDQMLEESRAAQIATGPEIERLRHREALLLREVRQQNNDSARFDAFFLRDRKNLESHESRTSEGGQIIRE